jgi:hypothetical protein
MVNVDVMQSGGHMDARVLLLEMMMAMMLAVLWRSFCLASLCQLFVGLAWEAISTALIKS